jgi:MoaD family protein
MKVEMYSLVRQITGEKEIELEAATVGRALEQLSDRYGADFKRQVFSRENGLSGSINILLKGKNIHVLQGLETPLVAGDAISMFFSIEGG